MSDNQNFGFGKFVPGFDFLQNLAKGGAQALPQSPTLSSWVAPTMNVEELEKRISELKAVHFWLDQNSKALGATIQALEVQKMTLATLKGMNLSMGELANALQLKPMAAAASPVAKPAPAPAPAPAPSQAPRVDSASASARTDAPKKNGATASPAVADGAGLGGVVDPLQWWGALTQQFQQIASEAMKDATQTATESAKRMADGATSASGKSASGKAAAPKSRAVTAAKKSGAAAKKTTAARKPRRTP